MRDPVSEELSKRAQQPMPWRWALVAALGLHLAAFFALLAAARPSPKALSLPTVRVHLAPLPVASAPSAPAAGRESGPPASKPLSPAPSPAPAQPKALRPAQGAKSQGGKGEKPQAPPATPAPSQGGEGKGSGAGGLNVASGTVEGPPFPYQYYLDRVLAAIEENWFKPQAPPGTRCRVRCRIARSGELKEAGLEEPSEHGAFDRSALRAVYAAAPFPPLPQGFAAPELILHLEFVQ